MKVSPFLVVIYLFNVTYVCGSVLNKRQTVGSEEEKIDSCPTNWDPSPCICTDRWTPKEATIYCNNIKSATEIKNAFAKLNVKALFAFFKMENSSATSLPANMFQKASFVSFAFYGNQLNSVDDGVFTGSEAAKSIVFHQNKFQTFNFKSLRGLTNLRHFELSEDILTAIPANAFEENLRLEVITLQENKIKTVAGHVFSNLPTLRSIYMNYNNLTILEDFSFSTPATSEAITLVIGNQTSHISKNAFKDLKVAKLMIGNNLKILDEEIFSPIIESVNKYDGYLETVGNLFECDEDKVKWILELSQEKRGRIAGFTCTDGRTLKDLIN